MPVLVSLPVDWVTAVVAQNLNPRVPGWVDHEGLGPQPCKVDTRGRLRGIAHAAGPGIQTEIAFIARRTHDNQVACLLLQVFDAPDSQTAQGQHRWIAQPNQLAVDDLRGVLKRNDQRLAARQRIP